MRRLREIETEYRLQRRRLAEAYQALAEACEEDAGLFSERWRLLAQAWSFERLNELIREHNAWYPIEADLPMDPRSRDYIPIRGHSYRRIELGAEWVLEHLPASSPGAAGPPTLPARPPREPL